MRAGHLALVEHRDRHLAELLGRGRIVGQQLPQADRAGESGGPGADEEHTDVDALVLGRRRLGHELAHLDGGWVVRRAPRHGRACYRFGTIVRRLVTDT